MSLIGATRLIVPIRIRLKSKQIPQGFSGALQAEVTSSHPSRALSALPGPADSHVAATTPATGWIPRREARVRPVVARRHRPELPGSGGEVPDLTPPPVHLPAVLPGLRPVPPRRDHRLPGQPVRAGRPVAGDPSGNARAPPPRTAGCPPRWRRDRSPCRAAWARSAPTWRRPAPSCPHPSCHPLSCLYRRSGAHCGGNGRERAEIVTQLSTGPNFGVQKLCG